VFSYASAKIARMMDRLSSLGSPLAALLSVLLVSSFSRAAPRVPTHVACVGDSITYGAGASDQATKSYPANLQGLFGANVQVKNFGHNGATMLSAPFGDLPYEDQAEYTAATSFVSGAGANAVVDVIIMLGTNDSKNFNWAPSGKPKNDQQFLIDYRVMVEHFSALPTKPQVFVALPLATGNSPCCSIDGMVIHDEIIPLLQQLAAEKHLPTIDLQTPTTGHPEYFGDGVHPTDEAYALVAKWMHDGLLVDPGAGGRGGEGGSGEGAVAGAGGASGGAGGVGTAGSVTGGAPSSPTAGNASANLGGAGSSVAGAGSSVAGASAAGGMNRGGAAGDNAAGSSPSPAPSDSSGCGIATPRPVASWLGVLGCVGIGWFAVRRRRIRR